MRARDASQRRAVSVLQATLRSKGTQFTAVALGKCCSKSYRWR